MIQLILHLIGDYILQSEWMAQNKTKSTWAALIHATIYALPFALIASPAAWIVIWGTHLVIDRFRLARYVIFAKNFMGAPSTWKPWAECKATGYHESVPAWMAVWLMIIVDNTLHLCINYLSLRYM